MSLTFTLWRGALLHRWESILFFVRVRAPKKLSFRDNSEQLSCCCAPFKFWGLFNCFWESYIHIWSTSSTFIALIYRLLLIFYYSVSICKDLIGPLVMTCSTWLVVCIRLNGLWTKRFPCGPLFLDYCMSYPSESKSSVYAYAYLAFAS